MPDVAASFVAFSAFNRGREIALRCAHTFVKAQIERQVVIEKRRHLLFVSFARRAQTLANQLAALLIGREIFQIRQVAR